ncbi:ABC transporter substrate-binding protein [Acuticoccus sp. I52.16.1]|uniref:ABC transporter substrate-binding protein n=1 Tax=Acuticoccus sp. I52.16.1 TaxID=2928472 RepID=UPI001FD1D1EC|nr:ABC transporter substrate-binding protein [Acuticoccus sp. I52.16.1]UOM35622.1 ABC transporter substrate-binding protein [Acuticoccus sp. I52.16.1]
MKVHATIALAALLGASVPALAGADDNSLTIGLGEELPGFDGYTSTSRDGVVMTRHLFDMLIWRNPDNFEYEPLLATEWERVDDKTYEFKLREGVTFTDGSPFSAEDVVGTLTYWADPDNGARSQSSVSWIDTVEAVDDMTVRIVSKEPFPAALEFVAGSLPIYPSDYFEKVGAAEFAKAPVGTGPYKLEGVSGGTTTLTMNETYFDSPKAPSIETLVIRTIPDDATRIAELLGGGIEWTWNVPADQVAQIDSVPGRSAVLGSTMRIAFIGLDAAGRTGEGNPLTNVQVRKAINHAIDKKTIVENLVGGDGEVIDVPCYPMQYGCDTSAAVTYDYDPEKAKELLAEAGFGDGFEVSMTSYRDRARAEAVQAYLGAVGIKANLEMLQARASFSGWREGQTEVWYGDWGSFSIADAQASLGNFFDGSSNDGFRDEEVMALVAEAANTVDEDVRKANYAKAIEMITERAYMVPMHTVTMGYAFDENLDFKPNVDELPRFFLASW